MFYAYWVYVCRTLWFCKIFLFQLGVEETMAVVSYYLTITSYLTTKH